MEHKKEKKTKDGHTEAGTAMDFELVNDEVFTDRDENPFRRKSGLMRSPPIQRTSSLSEERGRGKTSLSQKAGVLGTGSRSASSSDLHRGSDHGGRSPTRSAQKPLMERSISASKMDKEGKNYGTGDSDKGKAKRPREDSEDDLKDLKKMFTRLKNAINDIQKEVHQNTRVELKKGIKIAKGQADEIVRKWNALTLSLRERKKSKWGKDIGDDVIVVEDTKKTEKETRTIGTQTEGENKTKEDTSKTLKTLEGITNIEEFKKAEAKAWNQSLLSITEVVTGNLANAEVLTKVIIVDPEDKEMKKGPQKMMVDRFPEIREATEDMEILEQETRRRAKNGTAIFKTKLIYLRTDGTIENLWRKLVDLKEETKDEETIAIHQVNFVALGCLRKLVEWVFQGATTKVKICTVKVEKRRIIREPQKSTQAPRERKTHALVISQKGKTYSETLKDVKERLRNTAAGEAIKGLRSTREGQLLVILEKDEESLKKVKDELSQGGKQGEIRNVGGRKISLETMFIRGLDAEATKEDVNSALAGVLGTAEEANYKIGNLRPTRNETQTVTISVTRQCANVLNEIGTLRVGMVRCRVEPRIKVLAYNRCREYGHFAADCTGPNRKGECFNCGKEGHLVKDCKEKAACTICGVEGHRNGSGGCKEFRRALAWARRERETAPEEEANVPPPPQND